MKLLHVGANAYQPIDYSFYEPNSLHPCTTNVHCSKDLAHCPCPPAYMVC